MEGQQLSFVLVPDSSAARRVRRLVAATGAQSGLLIGTWPELLECSQRAYLTRKLENCWEEQLHTSLAGIKDAFWSESYSVSPNETSKAVEEEFFKIISATDPGAPLQISEFKDIADRPRRHLQDLIRLSEALDGKLPLELAAIKEVLQANSINTIRHIYVYHVDGNPVLTRWQSAFIEKLNGNASVEPNPELTRLLKEVLTEVQIKEPKTSLDRLKAHVFSSDPKKVALDQSVQWIGVRDFLEEAEVAAGMVQSILEKYEGTRPADIGLLLPESFEYAVAVEDTFSLGGLALSGLPVERWRRDLGREALFHFLYCRQKPSPAMAIAVCLVSPLMPWTREEGATLAQKLMKGDYRLQPMSSFNKEARMMLDLFSEGDETPNTLLQAVKTFTSLLDGRDEYSGHIYQAQVAAEGIYTDLENGSEIDWVNLRRRVNPRYITTGETPDFNLEGVTVWREGHEPWRPVRHLIVFGFAEGNYPTVPGPSAVFTASDTVSIRTKLDLPVRTLEEELLHRRSRFKRQLASVEESVSFLVPRRSPSGESQAPSESIVFMQELFEGIENLIFDIDSSADRSRIHHLALASQEAPTPPRTISATDINFSRDLMSLNLDTEGKIKPESPSSLETLMISRLAWLLRRLNAEPQLWAPERSNVMLLGTLAHQVFEDLFKKGSPVPKQEEIPDQVEALLDAAIRQYGPFLRSSQWQVERQHLATGIVNAAQVWRDVLIALNAEVLGNEEWLEGSLNSISIHGQADAILGLSDNRLLVVDYKRSSSGGRRPRMRLGYDSQASLYRTMLQTGGPKNAENEDLLGRLKTAKLTGIVYYMLNDQTALSDSALAESGGIPHWETLEGDIAGQAIALIEKRLKEIREGLLCLNREGDAQYFDKQAGIKPYALNNSPLIALFSMPGEAEEIQ